MSYNPYPHQTNPTNLNCQTKQMETQNANPTILSISDLPSRRQPQKKAAPSSLLTGLTPAYARDPFATSTESVSEDESEDDSIVERIDEQEIYGN